MKNCKRCGEQAADSDKFCGYCGQQLEIATTGAKMTQKDLCASDIRYNLAVVYHKMGKIDQALETIEQLLELEPEHPQALDLLNELLSSQEETAEEQA